MALRPRHDEAAGQQPGLRPRDPGRPRHHGHPARRPDQRRPRHHRLPAVPRRHRLDADLVGRRRLQRPHLRHLGRRRRRRLLGAAGRGRGLQHQDRGLGEAARRPERGPEHGLYRLGRLRHGHRRQRREAQEGRLVAPPPISAARTSRSGPRPIRRASSPTATRSSSTRSGWRPATTATSSRTTSAPTSTATTTRTRRSSPASPASSSTTRSPRTSSPRSTPAQYDSAQEGADAIAAAWEKITDQIGRDQQIALYKASLGIA